MSIPLGETLHFDVVTHDPSDGSVSNADAAPTFEVYEEDTDTAILTGQTMTQRGAIVGNYRGTVACTSGNGFEIGKWYSVIVEATVDSTQGKEVAKNFRVVIAETTEGTPVVDPGPITTGSGGISTTAESFTAAGSEPETNDYTDTVQEDGTYHIVEDDSTSTDVYYQFDIGGAGIPQSVTWIGYAQSAGDDYTVHFYNWGETDWDQVASLSGAPGTTPKTETWAATTAHVGTAANLGKVRVRFLSSDGTAIATDRLLCTYTFSSQSIGYEGGAIWLDAGASNTNTENYVDGTADNPVSTLAAARTLADALNLKTIHCMPGTTATLTDASWDGYELLGAGYNVALASRSIDGLTVYNATVTGIGEATTLHPNFIDCHIGAATMPPCNMKNCGIGHASGTFTAAADEGQYVFDNCYSEVPGSGAPVLNFDPVTGATGINNRGWKGGATYTLDGNCTLSHEVLAGGGTTITTGGGDAEIRGITRSLTLTMSASETVQFVGTTGPITLNGTTTAAVNLYGVASDVTDNTTAATVTNKTVSRENINAEVLDVMNVDTFSEPAQGAFTATPTIRYMLHSWYKWFRNKKANDGNETTLYADDGTTADHKQTTSTAGGTVTLDEWVTGA